MELMFTQEEIKIISYSCSVANHPVSKLPLEIRQEYLRGLQSVMPMNNAFMGVMFKAWEKSILGQGESVVYDYDSSKKAKTLVKSAIKLNRIGWRFWHWYRLSYPFFFDCFYLTSLSRPEVFHALMGRLIGFCGIITRKHMGRCFEYFKENKPCERIPDELLCHKEVNDVFCKDDLKRILVVANVSAGKSTLINSLVGYKLNKTATNACTKDLCYIFGKPQQDGFTIKTRIGGKYLYDDSIDQWSSDNAEQIGVYFASQSCLRGKKVCFIDTPGYNDARNQERGSVTENAIKANDYDAVLYVANAAYMGRDDEQNLLELIVRNTRKPIIFVMNGLDKYKPSDDSISESVTRYHNDIVKLGIRQPMIVPISARAAFLARLEEQNLLDEEEQFELEQAKKKFANKEYYDLPKYAYVQNSYPKMSTGMLEHTGINLLENIIANI